VDNWIHDRRIPFLKIGRTVFIPWREALETLSRDYRLNPRGEPEGPAMSAPFDPRDAPLPIDNYRRNHKVSPTSLWRYETQWSQLLEYGSVLATKALACKLAKAAWDVMVHDTDYDPKRMFPELAQSQTK
jgi:hypothetical protein